MARKSKEDAEQTRKAIIDSALEIFYEKGFSRATFDEIAKRINLTKGAVYWHFRNKADIIAAIIMQKVAESDVVMGNEQVKTLDELKQVCVKRARQIEQDENFRRFLFFMIYRMEWSETVLDCVWKQVGELCGLPDKRLRDCLQRLQTNGELPKHIDIVTMQELLSCLWKGCVDNYISGRKNIRSLSELVASGLDVMISGIKVEKI